MLDFFFMTFFFSTHPISGNAFDGNGEKKRGGWPYVLPCCKQHSKQLFAGDAADFGGMHLLQSSKILFVKIWLCHGI